MRRARVKESKLKKRLIIFFASFCSVLLAFFVALGFHSVLFPISDSENVIEESYVAPVDKATGKANVLLLGVDKDGLRTDTIIVASYDLDKNTINMLSIPRDTRMYIGGRYQKINAAHSLTQNGKIKGPQGTIEAVTRLTGIPINYYVEFSFEAFRNTIDALGGVYFDVPQRMHYSDPAQDLYIDLQAGYQLLDGDKAEQLVRFRKYPRGDIARVETQQQFIKAVAEQKLNISILTKVSDLYKTLQSDVKTNLTLIDVMKYLPNLKELSSENVTMYQLPGDFSGAEYAASYWLANITELKNLITNTFGYNASEITTGIKGKTDTGDDKVKAASGTASNNAATSKSSKKSSTEGSSNTAKASPVPKSSASPAPKSSPSPTPAANDGYISIPDADETDARDDDKKSDDKKQETDKTEKSGNSSDEKTETKPNTTAAVSKEETAAETNDDE